MEKQFLIDLVKYLVMNPTLTISILFFGMTVYICLMFAAAATS